jgi:putative NADH-flavin reductase
MTKVAILGATGQAGMDLTRVALKRLQEDKQQLQQQQQFTEIILIVRSKNKFPADLLKIIEDDSQNVQVKECSDFTSEQALKECLQGVDIAYSCIGYTKGSPTGYMSQTVLAVLKAFKDASSSDNNEYNKKRLVVLGGAALYLEKSDRPSLINKFFGAMIKMALGSDNFKDMQKTQDICIETCSGSDKEQPVEAIMVRPPMLVGGELTGEWDAEKFIMPGWAPPKVRRSNLADFMIKLSTHNEMWSKYRGFSPMVQDR